MGLGRGGRRRLGKEEFFFEKKNQKTFMSAVADLTGKVRDSAVKSFLLLFFKKEESSPYPFQGPKIRAASRR
jgi:hypothetical protein